MLQGLFGPGKGEGQIVIAALFYLVIAILIGRLGRTKKIGFAGAFLISLFFSPFIGLLFVIFSAPKPLLHIVHSAYQQENLSGQAYHQQEHYQQHYAAYQQEQQYYE